MRFLIVLGYLYLAGGCLVACRLGWYMAFRLDARDWRHASPPVWFAFARSILLWPLLVALGPREFINPRGILGVAGIDSDFPESDLLIEDPANSTGLPVPCGSHVRFRQTASLRQSAARGEFVFRSDDVEDWLTRRRVVYPDRPPEPELQRWLESRDTRIIEPADITRSASSFELIADEMVREGFGDVRCRRCDAQIAHEALIYADDDGEQMGWNFNRILCPERHPLLLVATIHIQM